MNRTALPQNDITSDPFETPARFFERTRSECIHLARCWLRRFQVTENTLAAEGAVHAAWVRILERHRRSPGPGTPALADIEKEFPAVLWCVVVDARRRQNADKRACGGGKIQDLDSAADVIDRHVTQPEEELIAREGEEQLLDWLRRVDPVLCDVALKLKSGFTKKEIAEQLNVSIWVVHRMVRRMREIWNAHVDDHESGDDSSRTDRAER
jgi:DNA-directed RNA polymerase specialized sigma24 family protein